MAQSILCPQVGQDLTEAKVVALHVKLGDTVKKGAIVAEVESEKASFEVEAFASGTVIALPYQVGDTATVLEPLVVLGTPEEAKTAASAPAAAPKAVVAASAPPLKASKGEAPRASERVLDGVLRSSPLARRIAAEAGIELATLAGTGPQGAVVLRDVESVIAKGHAGSRTSQSTTGKGGLAIKSLKNGSGHPIVFIHGFGSDLSSWRPFVATLSIGNPMVGIDLPGHGGSVGATAKDFDQLVADVAASLLAAGHHRVHLVGHSLGAGVSAALTKIHGIDVRSLTLLSPAGLGARIDGDFVQGFLSATSESALARWMEQLVHSPKALPAAFVRATLSAREGGDLAAKQKQLAHAVFEGSTQLFSIVDAVHRYHGPCRVVVGRRDSVIPADHVENLPGHVAVHRLEAVGHLPQVEATELVSRLVAETVRAAG